MNKTMDWDWLDDLDEKSLEWAMGYLDKKGKHSGYIPTSNASSFSTLDNIKSRVSSIHFDSDYRNFRQAYRQDKYRRNQKNKNKTSCSFIINSQAQVKLNLMSKEAGTTMTQVIEDLINNDYINLIAQKQIAKQASKEIKLLQEQAKKRNFTNQRMEIFRSKSKGKTLSKELELSGENKELSSLLEEVMNTEEKLKSQAEQTKETILHLESENKRLSDALEQQTLMYKSLKNAQERLKL